MFVIAGYTCIVVDCV